MQGIKKAEAEKGKGERERLPISPSLLRKIKTVWEPQACERDTKMLWAACCLSFFAFLRIGELTVPDEKSYDRGSHLSYSDVAVDNPSEPRMVRVRIKQSKTDPFRRGVDLFVATTSTDLCPVKAILNYLVVRGSEEGPLFIFADGRFLTRKLFVVAVRDALTSAGVDASKYCSHSFRIGAATTAAVQGIEDSVIKTLGRWNSLAYLQYVKIPRDKLAFYSSVLASESVTHSKPL